MSQEQGVDPVMRHPVPVVVNNDFFGSVHGSDGYGRLDVHSLGVECVPDQLGKDVHRAGTFHVPEDGVPACAYLLGLHCDNLRNSESSEGYPSSSRWRRCGSWRVPRGNGVTVVPEEPAECPRIWGGRIPTKSGRMGESLVDPA